MVRGLLTNLSAKVWSDIWQLQVERLRNSPGNNKGSGGTQPESVPVRRAPRLGARERPALCIENLLRQDTKQQHLRHEAKQAVAGQHVRSTCAVQVFNIVPTGVQPASTLPWLAGERPLPTTTRGAWKACVPNKVVNRGDPRHCLVILKAKHHGNYGAQGECGVLDSRFMSFVYSGNTGLR